jgi:hypothetical protein
MANVANRICATAIMADAPSRFARFDEQAKSSSCRPKITFSSPRADSLTLSSVDLAPGLDSAGGNLVKLSPDESSPVCPLLETFY